MYYRIQIKVDGEWRTMADTLHLRYAETIAHEWADGGRETRINDDFTDGLRYFAAHKYTLEGFTPWTT
jgi:hypothetical protein